MEEYLESLDIANLKLKMESELDCDYRANYDKAFLCDGRIAKYKAATYPSIVEIDKMFR